MADMFNKFPSIDNFHSLRKGLTKSAYYTPDFPIGYRGKVKLHGTNAAVTFAVDDRICAQSRSRIIAPGNDNMGFAAWVEENMDWFVSLQDLPAKHGFERPMTIYGEFCGKGIMKQVAISGIDRKIFAIFAIQFGETPSEDQESTTSVMVDPETIAKFLGETPEDIHILPWIDEVITINYSNVDTMQIAVDKLNTLVEEVEACDPWVKKVFDVDGIGEGLVLYPASFIQDNGLMLRNKFSNFTFKAKGEKHQVTKSREAVQLDPDVVESISAFADKFVTEGRLEQGVREINRGQFEFEHKFIGPFIGWFSKDVHKESVTELELSGLDWRQVNKEITRRAREWYLKKLSEF